MDAFIFNGDIECEACAVDRIRELQSQDVSDDGDSNTYPQGPYANGGGEADTPQHCGSCGLFMENPLTPDGMTYVDDRAAAAAGDFGSAIGKASGEYGWDDVAAFCEANNRPALAEWITYYLAWGR